MELGTRHVVVGIVLVIAASAFWMWREQDREREQIAARAAPVEPAARDPETTVMYRWQDDQGSWNFTETPPTDGRPFKEIRGTPNVTEVPTVVPDSGQPAIDTQPE